MLNNKSEIAINVILEKTQWLGHDSIKIDSVSAHYPVIYFDPYQIKSEIKADIILITHEHYDHCSVEDVKKILGDHTVIVTEKDSAKKLEQEIGKNAEGKIEILTPEQSINIKGVDIQAVHAYNINKKFHPKNKKWLGFIVNIGGVKVYHAGDTDLIPEMTQFRCDIAFLPVSGTYVMTAEEAVNAALEIKPQIAIPMHYGALVGSQLDAELFKKGLEGKINVEILRKD